METQTCEREAQTALLMSKALRWLIATGLRNHDFSVTVTPLYSVSEQHGGCTKASFGSMLGSDN
jgi:hypothetical protein